MEIDADQAAQDATVGGVAGVVFVTLIGTIVGFEFAAGPDPPNVGKQLHYLLATGALGTTAALAWRRSARVTVIGTVIAFVVTLALQPPTATAGGFAPDLTQLNVGLTVLVVVVAALATLEYALRNPDEVRVVLTPGALRVGATGGALHVGIVLATKGWLDPPAIYTATYAGIAMTIWIGGGAFLVGGSVGILYHHHRLKSPAFVLVVALLAAVYGTLGYAGDASIVGTPLQLYGWLWVGVFALVLVSAGIEYVVTRMEPPPGEIDVER